MKDEKGYTMFFLRLVIAAIFLYHGLPKLNMWGAESFVLGLPGFLWGVLGVVEVTAAVFILIGFWHRRAMYTLATVILGALVLVQIGPEVTATLERDLMIFAGTLLLASHGPGQIAIEKE